MSADASTPSPNDQLHAQFLKAYEGASQPEAVLADYCALHPGLAGEFQSLAGMNRLLDGACPQNAPQPPQQLGEFRIVRLIGRGGMGEIYEAYHDRLQRRVAVKIIRQGRISPEARDRFIREQQVLAQLHQTHIVPILTAGEEGPLQYFVMPYVDGAALHHVVKTAYQLETSSAGRRTPTLGKLASLVVSELHNREKSTQDTISSYKASAGSEQGPVSLESPGNHAGARLTLSTEYFRSVAEVMADAAEAIDHAHAVRHSKGVGILHRDMKPSNVMIDQAGQSWIIDFGLAAWVNGTAGNGATNADAGMAPEQFSVSGVLGTPEYMAPEQCRGKADRRTDVYGLGVTLYELLTLHRAFEAPTREAVLKLIQTAEPVPPRQRVAIVPADLAAICRKALKKDPAERYRTAGDLGVDLRRWLRLEPTLARPARTPRRVWMWARRNKAWAAAIVTALIASATLATGAVLYEEAKSREQKRASLNQDIRTIRLLPHGEHWFRDAWSRVEEAAKLGKDNDDLRDQAAACLQGLDVELEKHIDKDSSSLAWDAKGERLLMGGYTDRSGPTEEAKIWDSKTGLTHESGLAGSGPVAFRPDGTPVQLVVKDTRSFLLWDVDKKRALSTFVLPDKAEHHDQPLVLTSDGTLAAAATVSDEKGAIVVWDAASGRLLQKFAVSASALAFSPDKKLLASGDKDGQVALWSVESGKKVAEIPNGRNAIQSIAFSSKSRLLGEKNASVRGRLAVGDAGTLVTIWDLPLRKPIAQCRGSKHRVYSLAFSPDGTIVAAGARREIRVWDAVTGSFLLAFECGDFVNGLTFSADGKRLAASGRLGFPEAPRGTYAWALHNGHGIMTLRGLDARVEHVVYCPNGKYIAALSQAWQVGVWDAASGQLRYLLDVPKGIFADNAALAFDVEGKRLAFSTYKNAALYVVENGEKIKEWDLPPGLEDRLAYHPSGKMLLFRVETGGGKDAPFGNDGVIQPRVCRIRDLFASKPMEPLRTIPDFNLKIFATRISADGNYYAVEGLSGKPGSEQRSLRAFEGPTGKLLWSRPSNSPWDGRRFEADRDGKWLSVYTETRRGDDELCLNVEWPTGKEFGFAVRPASAFSPGKVYYRASNPKFPTSTTLIRVQDDTALVTLGIDTECTDHVPPFSPSLSQFAQGHIDGTVTIASLPEIQRRLAPLKMGW